MLEIPRDCPRLGGFEVPLARDAAGDWLVEGVYPVGVPLDAPWEAIEAELAASERGSMALRAGAVFGIDGPPVNPRAYVLEIVSCEPEAWLACPPAN